MVELVVQENKKLEDGIHIGVITRVEKRDKPFEYVDLVVMTKETGSMELRVGFPAYLSAESKIGLLLEKFVGKLLPGVSIDLDKLLVNQPIQFQTITKKAKNGKEYSNIIPESVKPYKV